MASPIDKEFMEHLAKLHRPETDCSARLKWYLTVVIALGGLNYPELIPDFYRTLLADFLVEEQHEAVTRELREGLTKACGIWGAAKVPFDQTLFSI